MSYLCFCIGRLKQKSAKFSINYSKGVIETSEMEIIVLCIGGSNSFITAIMCQADSYRTW